MSNKVNDELNDRLLDILDELDIMFKDCDENPHSDHASKIVSSARWIRRELDVAVIVKFVKESAGQFEYSDAIVRLLESDALTEH